MSDPFDYSINFNDTQKQTCEDIKKFMDSDDHNFLLLGPAGSGKTTVIVNALNVEGLRISFCAFTNKAAQVLKGISKRMPIKFHADFSTIHKLLRLTPIPGDELKYKFSRIKLEPLKNYDIIIFDECSTINCELYSYIVQMGDYIDRRFKKRIKFIFLGDYWQLPPVSEEISIIFQLAVKENWFISKLSKVMRSRNELMKNVNDSLLGWVDKFKNKKNNKESFDYFHLEFPFNIIKDRSVYLRSNDQLIDEYITTWKEKKDNNLIILTYSKANKIKINSTIQNIINMGNTERDDDIAAERAERGRAKRAGAKRAGANQTVDINEITKFYKGEKCCVDRPIEITLIDETNDIYEYHASENPEEKKKKRKDDSTFSSKLKMFESEKMVYLYPGEVFDIVSTKTVKIKNILNKYDNVPYYVGQKLYITKFDSDEVYEILYVNKRTLDNACERIRQVTNISDFGDIMEAYNRQYPVLDYGYCMTIYKAQGSEWANVYINLSSIIWSLIGNVHDEDTEINFKKIKMLFKTSYTALTRSTNNLKLLFF